MCNPARDDYVRLWTYKNVDQKQHILMEKQKRTKKTDKSEQKTDNA